MIGVIEYEMGNIQSVLNALECLSFKNKVVKTPEDLKEVDKVILPGVGAFSEGMNKLKEKKLVEALNDHIIKKGKYFLGICLGM